ncbi:HAMP domain-containing sensor histidine kinase [Paenibacillus paeoniae]|uniref:Heme sensor protein HssS n=1 Tax=Paenibacillus paeoniae TaxID=2292705 RepID=A0A371PM57_9BACL|nr:HAMP domain-containing sensor histidine kinase [Paenibacillus paeoniae]REK76729.1 HAMP domain-containing protein [Paenibacillus paeoniae]
MIKTLYVRIMATFLAVILFSLLSSFLIGYYFFKQEINSTGQNDMFAVGEEMKVLYDQTKPDHLDSFIQRMVNISAYPIQLYSETGEVKYYSIPDTKHVKVKPEAIRDVLLGNEYRSPSNGDPTYIGLPFTIDGQPHAMFMQFSSQNEDVLNRMMLLILLIGLIIGSVCVVLAARYLVKQLQALTHATKRLAKGDFDVTVKPTGEDEIGALTHHFNEMAKELKQLEQMRQDFVSNVSHEIQTPLTSISGFAKALKHGSLVAEDKRSHYLDIIIAESGRLSKLSDNLLKLASLDSEHHPFEATRYHLDEQIREVVVTCEPQWRAKNIIIDLDWEGAVPIIADRDQLNQVWMNVLGNSIKFTPDGGHIVITLSFSDDEVQLTITDSGIGIAPEQLDKVFERFYKSDQSRNRSIGGSGLGLAIAKKIVTLHHGRIAVMSEEGKGTTVTVQLPRRQDPYRS